VIAAPARRFEGEKNMPDDNFDRRRFLCGAAMTIVATQLGTLGSAKSNPLPEIQRGSNKTFGPLKQIDAGVLNVGYAEAGPVDGPAVVLLHGWPYDIHSYLDVAPLLASKGYRVIVPYLRGFGSTRFLSSDTFRNGQQSAVAVDVIGLMDALRIDKAILAGFDWGARTADIVAALWPERCKALVSVSGYIIVNLEANQKPLPPKAELGWWYQYYFATERGKAGYSQNRNEFNKLIWKNASPKWDFDDATFQRTAESFNNPDHVSIVIHNYRWRLSLADGERRYDQLEQKLFQGPAITVPAITIASDFDGPAADGKAYANKFSGKYSHRILSGIGHNVPQEAPQAFAEAVVEVDSYHSTHLSRTAGRADLSGLDTRADRAPRDARNASNGPARRGPHGGWCAALSILRRPRGSTRGRTKLVHRRRDCHHPSPGPVQRRVESGDRPAKPGNHPRRRGG
jgi:pimeloyl-ACP methyl ester carboxylesterase